MTTTLRPVVGLITIGQSPRSDVVPEMAAVIGPGVDVREAGALDGLTRPQIEALKPTGSDEILVTRLQDGTAVFIGKPKIVARVEAQIATLETSGGNAPVQSSAVRVAPPRSRVAICASTRATIFCLPMNTAVPSCSLSLIHI